MKIIRALYSAYSLLIFTLIFILTFPFFLVPILFKSQFKWIGVLNRIWARLWLFLSFLRVKIVYEVPLDSSKQFIFCPNHFSYLDIPSMGLCNVNLIFVGKSAMEKIPLFGWMYKKLHITVDRKSLRSRYETLVRSGQAIEEGKSLVIFPEGGILSKNPPQIVKFKDGAFRVAIEKKVPIVPVSILYNYLILPDNLLLRNKTLEIYFHEPIETKDLTIEDLPALRDKVWEKVNSKLIEN